MAVGDRQRIVVAAAAKVLREQPREGCSFPWLSNTHSDAAFKDRYDLICRIFGALGGKVYSKRPSSPPCDAYFGGSYNFILEFDEVQHFSTPRLKSLEMYPVDLPLGFPLNRYVDIARSLRNAGDRYRRAKRTKDFDFEGGRTAQRAFFDCFKDILPPLHGFNATVRIAESEIFADDGEHLSHQEIVEKVEVCLRDRMQRRIHAP